MGFISQLKELREQSVYTSYMEVSDIPIYDTIYLVSVRNQRARMFVEPFGAMILTNQGSKPKSYFDTNMYYSGMLDSPRAMFVEEITCGFIDDKNGIVPISSRWYSNSRLEFFINQKLYYTSHLYQLAEPAARFVDDKERKRMMDQDLWKLCRRPLGYPLLLERQQSFSVAIEFSEDPTVIQAPDRLVVYLHGRYFRAVL